MLVKPFASAVFGIDATTISIKIIFCVGIINNQ